MSIPLDRLYNYLHDIVNDDVIIYRFLPHGSKKIEDLVPLYPMPEIKKFLTTPVAICHDQEPLTYCHYSADEFCKNKIFNNTDLLSSINNRLSDMISHPNITDYFPLDLRVFAGGNFYDRIIITHSELNSCEVKKFEESNFIGVYFWSHALIAREWYRYAKHDPLLLKSNPKKLFLVYNRAWSNTREYRLKFAELIIKYNLISDCYMKFNPYDDNVYYQNYQYNNKNFQVTTQIEDFFMFNTSCSASSADYESADYQNTQIEIVLETLFDDSRWHLTEKILRPIACGHPFILAGTPGSLQYLQSYGFETFHGLIDETYDSITDPVERLTHIAKEMRRLSNLDKFSQDIVCKQLKIIAKKNQQRFFSKEFSQQIIDEFLKNFDLALIKIKKDRLGITFKKIRNFYETNMPDKINLAYPTVDSRCNLFEWALNLLNSR
jgi:hypothetical protein